jgi:esterase/lipase superfamily enzyme
MLVATTRRPVPAAGEFYSGERAKTLSFANIVVSIPPDKARNVGEVQWPSRTPGNPATDFVTVKAQRFDLTAARRWTDLHGAAGRKHRVLVFVHGFNNRFDDAVFRFAQIVHDARADVTPVLFTWPSRASVFSYGYDRESTNLSRDGLETVLNMLALDPAVSEVDILAHSMGNWLVLETLRQMAIRDRRIPAKIGDVMLAAPDVDVDVFSNEIADMGKQPPNFTLFVSQDDHALAASRFLWGSVSRLGAINPSTEPYKSELLAEHIKVIDLTNHEGVDTLNHGKFSTSPEVVRLVGERIEQGQSLTDTHVGFGDRLVSETTDVAASAGTGVGLILEAPIAAIDPDSRDNYSGEVHRLETEHGEVGSELTAGKN